MDLKEWVIKNWLTIGGELHNPDHDHIAELLHDDETFLAFAWTSSACMAKKRIVLGLCEKVMFNQGGWKKARQEQQMRDKGMSYVVLGFYLHRWLFVEGFAGGVGSRKEDLVDKKGDPKTLLHKFRDMFSKMPNWMKPKSFVEKVY